MRLSIRCEVVLASLVSAALGAQQAPAAPAPGRPLRILLATTSPPSTSDSALPGIFTRMLRASSFSNSTKRPPFTSAIVGSTDHDTECSELEEGVIATLQPLVYLRCREEMGDSAIVPLFLVKKNGESAAYYRASFVVAKGSPITGLSDARIKTLFLNHPRSASGFVAPLNRLAALRLIREPSLSAARDRYGANGVVYLRRRWDVARKVSKDWYSVGAVAGFDTSTLRAIDLNYETLPQDVLVITGDVRKHADELRRAIPAMFDATAGVPGAAAVLGASSYNITGVVPYDAPYQTMYDVLKGQASAVNANRGSAVDAVLAWISAVRNGVESLDGLLKSFVALGGTLAVVFAAWRKLRKPVSGGAGASAAPGPNTPAV